MKIYVLNLDTANNLNLNTYQSKNNLLSLYDYYTKNTRR